MKFIFELVSKSDELIPAETKHNKVIEGLKKIPKPWGIDNIEYLLPEFGKDISSIFRLNKYLQNGIKGDVIYSYRRSPLPKNDDRIYIDFNPQKINYKELIETVFKRYINFFTPYEASIFNLETVYYFFENRDKYDLSKYFRFSPVFFWNSEYCIDKLNISLKELNNKLNQDVEFVELYKDGIFVIASSKLLTLNESNELDTRLKGLL
jgi:hypothetical protein